MSRKTTGFKRSAVVTATGSSTELGDVVIESVTPDHDPGDGSGKKVIIRFRKADGTAEAFGIFRPNAEVDNFQPYRTLIDASCTTDTIPPVGGVTYYLLAEPYTVAVPMPIAPSGTKPKERGLRIVTHYITPTNTHTSNTNGRRL